MSVYIYDPDAKAKIALVEGERWLEHDLNAAYRSSTSCFDAFLAEWKAIEAVTTPDAREILNSECLTVRGNPAIYGLGGWNRYFVRYDGEIMFSAYHASNPEKEAQAKDAGFRVAR